MANEPNFYEKYEGHFLVARLNVRGTFSRSVVWLFDFSKEKGATGIIVNRPTGKNIGQCLSNFSGTPAGEVPVFDGGPVDSHKIAFLLRRRDFFSGNTHVKLGCSAEELADEISAPGVRAYGIAGHASWVPGQLEYELSCNVWFRAQMDAAIWDAGGGLVFWRRLVEKHGGVEAELMLRAPEDLSKN